MEQQVRDMEPILAKKAVEGQALVSRLKVEQAAADEVKKAVMKDEAAAKVSSYYPYIGTIAKTTYLPSKDHTLHIRSSFLDIIDLAFTNYKNKIRSSCNACNDCYGDLVVTTCG